MPRSSKSAYFKVIPSSPTGIVGKIVRVNRNGIAYARVPSGENYVLVRLLDKATDSAKKENSTIALEPIKAKALGVGLQTSEGQVVELTPENANTVIFTFDKIANYHGEDPEQIGLREGALVELEALEGIIQSAKLV